MSMFEEIDERLLKKKDAFFNDVKKNFSESESLIFEKMRRKILATNHQIWKHEKKIGELELEIKEGEKTLKKLRNTFFMTILALTIIHYFRDASVIDYGFTTLGFGGCFGFGVLYIRTAEIASQSEISNIKIANKILQSQLFEFELYYIPNIDEYMKIAEEKGLSSNNLSSSDIASINEFNVELNLAVISNMGHKIPTFWD